jgi:large subunit ribosomal protein L1
MPLDKKTLLDAVREAKTKSGKREFNQTVEFILDIKEIDMKSPEGKIQAVVDLPHATGKQNKICVVASGELALKARQAKADAVL